MTVVRAGMLMPAASVSVANTTFSRPSWNNSSTSAFHPARQPGCRCHAAPAVGNLGRGLRAYTGSFKLDEIRRVLDRAVPFHSSWIGMQQNWAQKKRGKGPCSRQMIRQSRELRPSPHDFLRSCTGRPALKQAPSLSAKPATPRRPHSALNCAFSGPGTAQTPDITGPLHTPDITGPLHPQHAARRLPSQSSRTAPRAAVARRDFTATAARTARGAHRAAGRRGGSTRRAAAAARAPWGSHRAVSTAAH